MATQRPEPDPIEELFEALIRHAKPPLPWLVRWSVDGRDPVAAAWDASASALGMVELLEFFGPLNDAYRARRAARRVDGRVVSPRFPDVRAAARVRGAVPTPPALDALLAAVGQRAQRQHSPVGELMHALESRGAPDASWLAAWSRDGEDPVSAAWRASQEPVPMAHLFALLRPHAVLDLVQSFVLLFESMSYGTLPDPEQAASVQGTERVLVDSLCAALELRWLRARELPAALRALRSAYHAAAPRGHWRIEGPLMSALALATTTPPTQAELAAVLPTLGVP